MIQTTYREAIGRALLEAMEADPDVILLGEEVGLYGGAYGVTKGLLDRFGPERVIDAPISEPGIVGAAIGAAIEVPDQPATRLPGAGPKTFSPGAASSTDGP